MDNHRKIISLHGPLPRKAWEAFFPKKAFHGVQTFLGQKIYGDVILNGRTNDQIMPRW